MKRPLILSLLYVLSLGICLPSYAYTDTEVEAKATEIKGLVKLIFAKPKDKEKYQYVFKDIFAGCAKTCKNELSKLASAKIIETYDEDFLLGGKINTEKSESGGTIYKANYKFHSVIDGDTIKVIGDDNSLVTVRMIGIDAPESSTTRFGYIECYGEEAKAMLESLLKEADEVTIELDPSQGNTDIYGRMLGYVFYNGENINRKMISLGYGWEYQYDKTHKYIKDFRNAESSAHSNKLGLWNPKTCNGERLKEGETPTGSGSPYYRNYSSSSSLNTSSTSGNGGLCGGYTWIKGPRGGCYHMVGSDKVYGDHACCDN